MSESVHGIGCQFHDASKRQCPAEISGADSESSLFTTADIVGFERVNGKWWCPAHVPKRDQARLAIVKPDGLSGKSQKKIEMFEKAKRLGVNVCYCEKCGPHGAIHC